MASVPGSTGPLVGRWHIAAPARTRVSPPDLVATHVIARFCTISAAEAVSAPSGPPPVQGCCVAVCTSGRPQCATVLGVAAHSGASARAGRGGRCQPR